MKLNHNLKCIKPCAKILNYNDYHSTECVIQFNLDTSMMLHSTDFFQKNIIIIQLIKIMLFIIISVKNFFI